MEKAKKLETTGPAGGTEEFNYNGSSMNRKIINPEGKVVSEVTTAVGGETASKSADGRDIKVWTYLSIIIGVYVCRVSYGVTC